MSTVWEVRRSYHHDNSRTGEGGHLLVEEEGISAHSENCLERTLHCLSHVPCASLIAWILLLLGLGGIAGSLVVSADRTRDILDNEQFLPFLEFTVIGVVCGMFVIGTGLLFLGHFSSEPNCRHAFNTSGKNTCGRAVNIFMVVLTYILCFAWVVASALLTYPITLLYLVLYAVPRNCVNCADSNVTNCINLYNYGFWDKKICDSDLERFRSHATDLLICFSAVCISAIIIVISLIHFLMVISANITHLRDARFATMNAYDDAEEAQHAKQNDTTM